ncbi:MAG: FAD-dependent thymidylate synthase [Candidatus Bipolaricaulia bacterium]
MPEQEPTKHKEHEIYTVLGALPEPGGYGLAKFSRSARPYKDWVRELSQAGAERFYEAFYFKYGHASIADLTHIALALETLSNVATVEVWDYPLLDGQESSTRYQDFQERGVHFPAELRGTRFEGPFRETTDRLIATYAELHSALTEAMEAEHRSERPEGMSDAAYWRTIRARAFDVARYLLPTGILTGMGIILNARTAEQMIGDLLAHPLEEVREVGQEIKAAIKERPAFNLIQEKLEPLLDELLELSDGDDRTKQIIEEIQQVTYFDAPLAPTLVKYTEPNQYRRDTYADLMSYATALLADLGEPDGTRGVELFTALDLEDELLASILYKVNPYSYSFRQIINKLSQLSQRERDDLLKLVYKHRGQYDTPIRETASGYRLIYDLCLDNGSFRDLHRHRRCIQIIKDLGPTYGYDIPDAIEHYDLTAAYRTVMEATGELAVEIEQEHLLVSQFLLPLGFRRRVLFKMDFAELAYIVENRTPAEGHFSYRELSWGMYTAAQEKYPRLTRHIRAVDPEQSAFFDR